MTVNVGALVSLSVKPSAPFNISRRFSRISSELLTLKIEIKTVYNPYTSSAFETKEGIDSIDRKTKHALV